MRACRPLCHRRKEIGLDVLCDEIKSISELKGVIAAKKKTRSSSLAAFSCLQFGDNNPV